MLGPVLVAHKLQARPEWAEPLLVGARVALSALLLLILVTLLGGIAAVAWELRRLFSDDVDVVLRRVLIGVLILLAVVEVLMTALAYLVEGRVRVTLVVDAILVVMLTEIISLWLRGAAWPSFLVLVGVIGVLSGVRVLTVRFCPSLPRRQEDGAAAEP
jgi:uncharacterized membrane protein (DUF373 family)